MTFRFEAVMSRTLTLETITKDFFFGAPISAIRSAVKHGGLPGRKIGRQWYFDEQAVRDWLARREQKNQARENQKVINALCQSFDPDSVPDEMGECTLSEPDRTRGEAGSASCRKRKSDPSRRRRGP